MIFLFILASAILGFVRKCEQIEIIMELKLKLRLIRDKLKLTQDQIGEKLGLTSNSRRARVSEWESGRSEPKREILIRYAEIYDVNLKKLIDDREELK